MGTQPTLCSELHASQPQLLLVTWAHRQVLLGGCFTLSLYLTDPLQALAYIALPTTASTSDPEKAALSLRLGYVPLLCAPRCSFSRDHLPCCTMIPSFYVYIP